VSKENRNFGKNGEDAAANYLKSQGYQILFRNYKTRFAEIDIIAREKNTYCFVEVKSRGSERFGLGQEAVTQIKQAKIAKAALIFLQENNSLDKKSRFDVVAISQQHGERCFQLIRDAFIYSV